MLDSGGKSPPVCPCGWEKAPRGRGGLDHGVGDMPRMRREDAQSQTRKDVGVVSLGERDFLALELCWTKGTSCSNQGLAFRPTGDLLRRCLTARSRIRKREKWEVTDGSGGFSWTMVVFKRFRKIKKTYTPSRTMIPRMPVRALRSPGTSTGETPVLPTFAGDSQQPRRGKRAQQAAVAALWRALV
jgi:hypothetical protein